MGDTVSYSVIFLNENPMLEMVLAIIHSVINIPNTVFSLKEIRTQC